MNPNSLLKRCILFCLFLISQLIYGQLNDFNFSVSVTDESCAGNGAINMTVSGGTTNSAFTYYLFLYPNIDTPIAQTSANTFSNLESGDYRVQAIQSLGELQNSQSTDATINNIISALDYEVSQVFLGDCDSASLIITTLSGNAQSFEIISGPVTANLQTDNTFNNLPQGTYVIRVYDSCDNALTKTFTLLLNNATFSITVIEQPDIVNNCEETTIASVITADNESVLAYPISVNYTSSLLDGSESISFTQTYDSGPDTQLELAETIVNYNDQIFEIEIVVEDQCGTTMSLIELIDPNPEVIMNIIPGLCGSNLIINVSNILPPYTLEFIEAPSDFDPLDYNDNVDGIYTNLLISFGDTDTSLPFGTYEVSVNDSCNRISTATIDLIEEPIEPLISAINEGCNPLLGSLFVSIPDREIVYAEFIEVPEAYENTPPHDISNFITMNGALAIEELPVGNYILEMIDDCGNIYLEEFLIPDLTELPVNVVTSPNCTDDTGTLRIAGAYGPIETVFITEAPTTFTMELPFDYSDAILSAGFFYVDNLPAGNYTIAYSDSCGNEFVINQEILSYSSNPSIYNLQINCGSFDVGIFDTDDSVVNQSYWLQRYFPENNGWGNPNTSIIYIEGEMPNVENSISIENDETIFNIFATGSFRLIKAFQPLNNPNPELYCYDIFAEFEVGADLIINDVYNLNCDGGSGPSDILVDVAGIPPYNFSIVAPIVIDNGTNNIFTNLDPGVYEIKVEDACGSIETILINLLDLLPVLSIETPADLVICNELNNNQAIFDLSLQNAELLGNQNPEHITITYHLNQNDADSGENPIAENYQNISNPQTLYVRMRHNTLDICYETTSFQLIVGFFPQIGPDEFITICDNSTSTLSADYGYSNYLWSTGETSRTIVVDTAGEYIVTVSNDYNDLSCEATKTYTIAVSSEANIEAVTTQDFTSNNNSIYVEVSGFGDYEFSLDGIHYQSESYFTGLVTGEYTIFIRDKNGCGIISKDVFLLNYRKFFTPNGDSDNEFWQISGSLFEPDLQIYIYNRYGKLLTVFSGGHSGWDGTYNGENMPTSDYWFVVERGNGKTYTGHFTLKR